LAIDTVAWDAVGADVELSFACMFTHEAPGSVMAGGLLHLDRSLGSALSRLRAAGDFRAEPMETLLVDQLPSGIRARAVMVIGLGDPEDLAAERLERATRVAFREAVRLGVSTAAFAPSLLDAGIEPDRIADAPSAMLRGLLTASDAEQRLVEARLASPAQIRHWSFDAGAAHIESAAKAFKKAFEAARQERS
jgi:hypothetical protein